MKRIASITLYFARKQLADEGREIGAEDLYVGHKYEIPQVEEESFNNK